MKKLLILLLAFIAHAAVAQVGYNDYYTPVALPMYQPVVVDYEYPSTVQVIVIQQYTPVVDPYQLYPVYQPQWNYSSTLAVSLPLYWQPIEPCKEGEIQHGPIDGNYIR